jgi:hypothetical protein
MADTIQTPRKDVPAEEQRKEEKAPDLVQQLDPLEMMIVFQQDRQKAAEGLPQVKVEGENKAGDNKAEAPKLQGAEKDRAQYVQDTLSDMANLFAENPEELQKQLATEKQDGIFGPASQKALGDYLKFLDTRVLLTIKEWDALKPTEALPPGCPITMSADKHQRMVSPELFRSLASADSVNAQWNIDTRQVPDEAALDKLDGAFDWLAKCNRSLTEAQNEFKDRTYTELIKENNLPKEWNKKPGDDGDAWRASAEENIDLAVRTRNYVAAMQNLFKSSKDSDFPMDVPAGAKLVVEHKGKTMEVTGANIRSEEARTMLKEGTVKEVLLDLPKDLRQEDPENAQKIEAMRGWLKKYGDKIDQAITELAKLQANPDSVIFFGDQEVHGGLKGRFSGNGEFLGLVDPKRYSAKQGEELKDVNLLGYDVSCELITEGENKGKYKVTQNIQAENAPWYAYQNIRCFGVENVGKPMPVETKIVAPEDFLWVKNGDKIEMVQAKNMPSFIRGQKAGYYGEKALIATMDAAMLVTGTIELGVAIKGARIATTAATAGLKLTAGQAARQIGVASTRIVVAGAGIANNAGARSTEVGKWVNNARTAYFLGDITQGLARGGFAAARSGANWVRGAEAAAPTALSGADKVHKIIHGGKLLDGTKVASSVPSWVRHADTVGKIGFRTTELGFGYIVYKDLKSQVHDLQRAGQRDSKRDAMAAIGDGRGLQVVERGAFDPKSKENLDSARAVLDNYASSLVSGKPADTQKRVNEVFDETKKLMAPDAKAEDKQKYLAKLAANHRLRTEDKDVQLASRIAMLYLSRDQDGAIPESLAGSPQVKTKDLVEQMRRDLAVPKQGSREIVAGDCLVRVGALSHQSYAAVLQNVLRNPESTKEDRMRALTDAFGARMASIVDGLRYAEQHPDTTLSNVDQAREKGRNFGVSSQDLLKTLAESARSDKDPDVRAMAAALHYGLNEPNAEKRTELLGRFNESWQRLGSNPGSFARTIETALEGDMKGNLHAAVAVSCLTDAGNVEKQKAITAAMAEAVSKTDPTKALRAIEALMPDRLAQLDKDNPTLAGQARAAALELVKKPETPDQDDALCALLKKMEPFLKNGDVGNKAELTKRLQGLITESAANKDYAAAFPNTRAAAIDTLAGLGHQGSVELIRARIQDKSPVVRTAAVKALESLKDTELRKLVNELIEKETDPSAAAALRDVRFAQQRIEPGTAEYSRMYQDALKDLIGDLAKHKHLDGFGSGQQLQWIRDNYDLLDVDKFRERCNDAAKGAMGGWDRFWSMKETEALAEQKKVFELSDARLEQWKDLCKTAKGSGERADKAKLALFYILTHNGHPMGGDQGLSIQITGDKYHTKLYNFDWKHMAARAFKDAADTGCGSRDITAYCIRQALREGNIQGHVSFELLKAGRNLMKESKGGYTMSREQMAKMTAEALETELRRKHEDQADYYQDELLKDLAKYRHRMVFPVLDAMADKSKFEGVRKSAKAILDEFRYSVNVMYDETPVDQTTAAVDRATRLKAALGDGNNADSTVQEIFRAYKGYKVSKPDDPGIPFLFQALNDKNDRTRMAAAKVVVEAGLAADHPLRVKAVQTFENLAAQGSVERIKSDAAAELASARKR